MRIDERRTVGERGPWGGEAGPKPRSNGDERSIAMQGISALRFYGVMLAGCAVAASFLVVCLLVASYHVKPGTEQEESPVLKYPAFLLYVFLYLVGTVLTNAQFTLAVPRFCTQRHQLRASLYRSWSYWGLDQSLAART